MKRTIRIEGMMCGHCSGRVKKALEAVAGDVSDEALAKAVTDAGYKVAGIE